MQSTAAGDIQTVNLESCATAGVSGTIHGVLALTRSGRAASGGAWRGRVISGATTVDTSSTQVGALYLTTGHMMSTDPNTGSAWTTAAIDALDIAMRYSKTLSVQTAAFAITANDVGLAAQRKLGVATAAYVVSANDVGLRAQRKLTVATAAFAATFNDVTLTYNPAGGYTLPVQTAPFVITANDVGLKAQRRLSVDPMAMVVTGNDVAFAKGYTLSVSPAVFVITGNDVGRVHHKRLTVDTLQLSITGNPLGSPVVAPPPRAKFSTRLWSQDVARARAYDELDGADGLAALERKRTIGYEFTGGRTFADDQGAYDDGKPY
jgi:hypothetical protein